VNPLSASLLPDTAAISSNGVLTIGGIDTIQLAAEYGTPLFVYDEAHLRARCRETVAAFGGGAVYATKAFLCTAMARLAHDEGLRLDVATGGEFAVARAAGVPATDMVFHGNNKSSAELQMALEQEVGCLVVDSFDEIDRIEALVGRGLKPPEVLIRITPGVEAHTHEFVRTGQDDSKFGFTVSTGAASEAVSRAETSRAMMLRGIHAHIGSQVFRSESYAEALGAIAAFTGPDRFQEVSIGGGLGVGYVEGEEAPSITEWAETIRAAAAHHGLQSRISAEPGRAITALAAVTLYTVGTIKVIPGIRTYVAVDGGMSDNPRPVLYGSGYETFLPGAVKAPRSQEIRLVGKHCETGDVLVSAGWLPADVEVGDIVATPVTGAYGHSMGSNYNKVLRPAVVFVADGKARLVVRRETYEDLLITDLGP
jgi:diaminopimelate decarboxylase